MSRLRTCGAARAAAYRERSSTLSTVALMDEATLRANRADFERVTFRPRVLVDVSRRDLGTRVLGAPVQAPIILAPTGLAGLVAPRGEILAARVAARRGLGYLL